MTTLNRPHPGSRHKVNSFFGHGPDGLVVVDGTLTLSDARLARQAITDSGRVLAGMVITHPQPDHYAGVAEIIGNDDIPIVTTETVDQIIRRDADVKNTSVGLMMGDEWPPRRRFPNRTVAADTHLILAGEACIAVELGETGAHLLDAKVVQCAYATSTCLIRVHPWCGRRAARSDWCQGRISYAGCRVRADRLVAACIKGAQGGPR